MYYNFIANSFIKWNYFWSPLLRSRDFPRSNYAILALIGGVAITLAVVSYQYSTYSSSQVIGSASNEIQSNSQRQAHDLSRILINKIDAINNNLRVVAAGRALQSADNLESGKQILSGMQDTTKQLTDFYMWLDNGGRVLWISDISSNDYEQYGGVDLSYRPYFTVPRDTGEPYYSTAIVSNDQIPRIYVARPVFGESGTFQGVIVAAIRLEVLGNYLQSQIPADSQGSVGMMDRTGVVLYSSDLTLLGTNVFDDSFQRKLPGDLRPAFNDFLRKSLSGGSGVEQLTYRGTSSALAYETVVVDGHDFAVLYVTASQTFAGNMLSLFDQQRTVGAVLILTLGGLAVGMAILVLSWNGKLHKIVKSKTAALEEAVDSLANANRRLQEHDKVQREFVNIAAHELRTPIQPLIGVIETMQLSMSEHGTDYVTLSKEEIDMLARNSQRLERLTQNLLDVTRIENNTLTLEKERFDLNEKILDALRDLVERNNAGTPVGNQRDGFFEWQYKDGNSDVKVSLSRPTQTTMVEADKTRMFEVVSNLLSNSLKFTKAGSIEMHLTKQDERTALVKVKDSGKGIDPSILPMLFNKFVTKSEKGTGLGLYISKNIIEAHGGKMWCENNVGESGASFYFTLPILDGQAATIPVDAVSRDRN